MEVAGIVWDAAKYLCGCASKQAAYAYDLEQNLRSLEENWRNLKDMKEDVERKLEEAENTGLMRRAQQVSAWLQRIQAIQKVSILCLTPSFPL